MKDEDIRHLATLARIELTEEEVESYRKEFTDILGYIEQIKEVAMEEGGVIESASSRNIFREDENPQESGIYSEDILNSAPNRNGDYVEVQKVLNTDNGGA